LRWRASIQSTTAEVWARLVDFERMHIWFLGVKRVTLLAAEPSVGAVRIMRLVAGTAHRERITRWEPPDRFSIVVLDPPFIGRYWVADIDLHEHRVGGDPPGVDLFWELRYEPRFGLAGRLIDRLLIQPILDVAFRTSLRRLRLWIEAGRVR
jgi:hypothetical protein